MLSFFQEFDREKERMAKLNKFQNGVVNLNIGGHKFTTSLQTLRSDPSSMLGVMFSGRHPIIKQDDESIFIDRDGRHFHAILNYLRGTITSVKQLPDDKLTLSDLSTEAEYYQLQGLHEMINPKQKVLKPIEKENGSLNQSYLDQRFKILSDGSKKTISDTILRNYNLDNLAFNRIYFFHLLDLSGSSLVNTTISECFFYRGSRLSFDYTDLNNCSIMISTPAFEREFINMIENKKITFYNAKNIDLAKFGSEKIRRVIKKAYNL